MTGGIRRQAGVIAGHEPCGVVTAVGSGVTDKEAKVGVLRNPVVRER